MNAVIKIPAGNSELFVRVCEFGKVTPAKLLILLLSFLLIAPGSARAQPVSHHLDSITALPDRTIALTLAGSVSNMFRLTGTISNQFRQMFDLYLVEASTNLNDWIPLTMAARTNSDPNPLIFEDTKAPGLPRRFYRAFTNHLLSPFFKPTGPYAVGTVDRVMIDPARTNLYRYSPPTNTFMVTFWYPADPAPAGVLPAPMWDKRLAADPALYAYAGYDTQWTNICPSAVGHRFCGIPLPASATRFPVIIYSHGARGFRKLASQRGEELASHGYVFVAMDHTDCWATEFPDGRYLIGGAGDVAARLKDMAFLVDELDVLNSSDPLFAGRLDLDRIGVFGGSYGGMVVETCRTNSRVKCAVVYDARNVQLNPAGLQKPLLIALGETNSYYVQDWWLFSQAVTNAVFLQFRGADHFTPSDVGWTAQIPWGRGPALAENACVLWFFDTYLKGETPPFPTNPEIYNKHIK